MDVVTWTGDGSSPRSFTGYDFSPDLVWIKQRSSTADHALIDTVRGTSANSLSSNLTSAESNAGLTVNSFDSGGFTLSTGSINFSYANTNAQTYVGWAWDAGSSTVSNTNGTITSSVRANPSAGFSIVQWTTTGTWPRTIGHGIGSEPHFIIDKCTNNTGTWTVYHKSLGNSAYIFLNTTAGQVTGSNIWNGTTPSSTVFSVNDSSFWGNSGFTHISYCFAPVAGYSAFGRYTGNGSTDGPFVWTGFRPSLILLKPTSTLGNWTFLDTTRNTVNVAKSRLHPNLSDAEATSDTLDILSNGFKIYRTGATENSSGATYIYAAFAENPFSVARAR
jgi:hypothetical protein